MKTTGIKKIAIGALCAGMMAIAGAASAADWGHHGFRGHSWGPRVGLSFGVGIGAPVYPAPAYVDPYYDPYYVAPAYGPEVVIGGGWSGGGGYYHGGGHFEHGGGFGRGGGFSHGGGRGGRGHR